MKRFGERDIVLINFRIHSEEFLSKEYIVIKMKRIILRQFNPLQAEQLAEQLQVSLPIAKLLLIRGISEKNEARKFLHPGREGIHSPFLLKGMEAAVSIIFNSIEKGENICIYGDYDVDGVTATSLLYLYLQDLGVKISYYLPNRHEEGYGLNAEAIQKIADSGTNLIITVDTGISAVEEVKLAKELGMKIIVTDHHECQEIIPEADALIDPKQPGDHYPFSGIAGVGVAFKLICALSERLQKGDPFRLLELVAIGTVSDLMPLVDENRIFVKEGLQKMKTPELHGTVALMEVASISPDSVSSSTIGFQIGPRINAAGRMGDASRAVELFLAREKTKAKEMAEILQAENAKRQDAENSIIEEVLAQISLQKLEEDKVLVVAGENWQQGVVGIVASRILERYYRPIILLSIQGDLATGSGRSVEGFNLFEALQSCKELFVKFGGHEMAAGMTLPKDKISEFRERLNRYSEAVLTEEILIPKEEVDFVMEPAEMKTALIEEMTLLAPFGIGNPEPRIMIESPLSDITRMGNEKQHLRLGFAKEDAYIEGVAFKHGWMAETLSSGFPVLATGSLQINEWRGIRKPQILLRYISQSQRLFDFTEKILARIKEEPESWQYGGLSREEMKAIFFIWKKNWLEHKTKISWEAVPTLFGKQKAELAKMIAASAVLEELNIARFDWSNWGVQFQMDMDIKTDLNSSKLFLQLQKSLPQTEKRKE